VNPAKFEVCPPPERIFSYRIPHEAHNRRLDHFLASLHAELSRSRLQTLIKDGHVKVNDALSKAGYRLKAGERVDLSIPRDDPLDLEPETVPFELIHEDSAILVLNKPPGLVVHPAPGHSTGTLVHGLLKHCRDLSGIGGKLRPGIVHRLDKDTSGLMVIAKNDFAHDALSRQFRAGRVNKEYLAIVHGLLPSANGEINLAIARHPKKRKEMSVVRAGGKNALTLWNRLEEFENGFSLLRVTLKTGRTHQIRVHLSHIGHPILGDPVYGFGRRWLKTRPCLRTGILQKIERQMLHSRLLGFEHPADRRYVEFEAPLPTDFRDAVEFLKSPPNGQ
jgi:23S rRNA pseudouridine1911/1915/1917 synthase